LFFVNGFTYTNVVPWLPTIKRSLDLSNSELGLAIAAMPFGAITTGMGVGLFIRRFGSGRTAVGSTAVALAALPFVALASHWWALAAALFAIGCGDSWADAAQNSHGLRVQRHYGRTIINSFHAVWSIAALSGGFFGAAMAGIGVPMEIHLLVVSVLCLGVVSCAYRWLLRGDDHDSGRTAGASHGGGLRRRGRLRVPRAVVGAVATLSVLLMLAGAIEDSAASWGAVYMSGELAAGPFVAGLPFVACQAMMTVGRLFGDRTTDRFGAVSVGRVGALVAGSGMALALLQANTVTAIAGFGLMGIGIATLFPLTLAAAGHVPGLRTGDGVTIVSWVGRLGFLVFPPLVGAVADATTLRTALWLVPVAALGAVALSGALRDRR
jgi:fucose permease